MNLIDLIFEDHTIHHVNVDQIVEIVEFKDIPYDKQQEIEKQVNDEASKEFLRLSHENICNRWYMPPSMERLRHKYYKPLYDKAVEKGTIDKVKLKMANKEEYILPCNLNQFTDISRGIKNGK